MFGFLRRRTQTEHELCQESLSGYLDHRLTSREHAQVERHLRECASCRADLQSLRETVALLRATPALTPPRSFLLPVPKAAPVRPAPRPRAAYLYLQTATAAATVLLVLVISADALLRFQLGSTVLRSPSERAPVAVMLGEATAIPTPEHTSVAQAEELRALGAPQEPPVGSQPTPAVAGDASTAPGASPQPQTMLVAGQPSETGNAGATEASEVQATGEPEGAPSRTFAKSAAAPPTTPTEGPAIPSAVAAGEESPLPLPDVEPTAMLPAADTPLSPAATSAAEIPPTATSAPEIAPTATSTPPAEISEPAAVAMPPTSGAAPSAQPGAWLRDEPGAQPPESYGGPLAILESARPALRWARFVLIPLVAVLVAVTLWARRRLQSA